MNTRWANELTIKYTNTEPRLNNNTELHLKLNKQSTKNCSHVYMCVIVHNCCTQQSSEQF